MKPVLNLVSVKDYCKKFNITDAAVRKKIKTETLTSVIYDDITYVVIESDEIYKLKNQLKLKTQQLKTIQNELLLYTNQKETIDKLEAKIEKLEDKLEHTTEKKEELYEKVIGHMIQLEYKK